jgi:hypothetical protein
MQGSVGEQPLQNAHKKRPKKTQVLPLGSASQYSQLSQGTNSNRFSARLG